jgi:hypothetical protein
MMSRCTDDQWCMGEEGGTGSGRNSREIRSYVPSLHALGAGSLMQPPSCNMVACVQHGVYMEVGALDRSVAQPTRYKHVAALVT